MAAINKGIVTSFGNTPQAVDDVFNIGAPGASGPTAPIFIDVMGNDKAGGAKSLYSLDDADSVGGIRPTDLLTQDLARTAATSTDTSANGARIWITANGQVGYDASTLNPEALLAIQALGAGEYYTDTFTYAIRMANGTLSWATAEIRIAGVNDAATISGPSTGSTVEDTDGQLHAEGTLTVTDLDAGQNVFQAPTATSLVGTYGTFTFNPTNGQWTYDLDHAKADHLYGGEVVHDTLVVKSLDGTATRTIEITVTGTNDAAVLSADVEELTEGDTAAAISTSGTLTNDDVDSPETFVAQTDTAGDYGTFSIDANGAWTYTASSAHDEFVGGTTYTDTFTVAAADGTLTSVTINILGTNDAAVLSADVEELTEGDTAAAISTSGTLTNDDVDSPETFVAQTDTAGDYGTFSIDANGAWTYTASSAHDEFVGGTTYTDTFTVAAADGTLTSVTINILGTNDAAVLSADVEELTEGDTAAAISTSGTLTNDDVDSPETFVAQTDTAGDYGTFSIDANGAWTYTASSAHDEFVGGTTYTDTFTVAAADGTLTSVTINILGTNDAAVLSADVEELTEGDTAAAISTSGTLTNDDVDSPETFVAQTDTAGDYGTFSIDANGAWTYTASSAHDEFVGGTTYTDTFTVAAADGTLTSVTINILGTNDAAVLSADVEELTEGDTAAAISTSGTLTNDDVDSPETFVAQTDTAGDYGTFSIDANGAWTYTASSAHDEFVGGTTYTDTFTVAAADGTLTSVTINILGTNDAAVLSADVEELTEGDTAAAISTSGTLTNDDVDSPETFVAQTDTAGDYGTFSIDANGAWTYTASSAHDEFVGGTTYTDTFTVAAADGTLTSVTINILGTNDAAVLSADVEELTEGDTAAAISTSGTLTNDDVDSPETFVAQTDTAGDYGTFSIDANGAWTYTASSAHDEFVGGTTYTDTFTVAAADGTLTSVTINILGTNDAAVLSADVEELTEGDTAAAISTSGTLTNDDVDSPETFVAQTDTAGDYGTFSIDANGAWTYTASSAHDEFVGGTTYTDTFTVAAADGTLTSVTINILGTNDAAVLSADVEELTEGDTAAAISTSGTLTNDDVDSPETFVAQTDTAGDYGTFSIDANGAWTYTASSAHDEFVGGTTYTDTFTVAAADGTLTSVTINILGTNDAAVLSADVEELTEGDTAAAISTSGTLTNDDVDSPETFVAQTDTAGDYGTFSIDANGAWTYTASSAHDEFVGGTTYTDTFTVAAADGTLTSVTINILGTNDAAVLSADVEELTEGDTAAAISTSGTLTNDDVDSPETFVAQTDTAGDYGTFSIDANGAWTYTASSAHDEFVGGTTYTDTFTVAAADGTLTSVTINILGTNDAAVLSADVEELTEGDTAAAISTSGTLTNDDVDSPETFVAQTDTAGDYGTFSIDANGAWTYTASSAHDEFVGGTTYTDTFTVAAADGTLTSVTINILGTNDAAVLSADVEELTEGDTAAAISTSGTLTNDDVDSPETFVAQTDTAGDYGTFSIDANGAWTYTASSAHDEFVGGTTYTDTFTVAAADGTLTSVTINILGTNDAAVLSADVEELTEGDTAAAISTSGTLTNDDVDSPETFVAQTDTAGDYGTFSIDANGAWTYTASSAHDEFVGGTTYTDTFTVAAADGTLTSVTINILGTNDAAVLSADVEELTEGDTAAAISTSGTLTNDDVDSPETFVAQTDTAGDYGTFSIDANGAWTYTASSAHDEFVGGTTYTDTFTVAAADGTLTSVTINILGTNDAAVLSADVEELTEGDTAAAISTSGTLTNDDVDSPETFVAQTDTAGDYGTFSIDANGAWTYTASSAHDEFVGGTTYTDTFTVAAADGTLTSVTINILGTNDAAVLSADVEELTEGDTAAAISTSGTLTNDDVDSPETFVAQTDTAGDYGTFSIDANGAWTYTASSAHDEFVGGTTYTDTFTVAAADGTLTSVTINILGTNDAAVLSADVEELTEGDTAAAISTSGTLTNDDVDSPETFVAQTDTAGDYGTFSIDANGAWTYTASSAHDEFVGGTTYTDTFTVAAADGTLTSVTINILGTNDAAVLSADVEELTEGDTAAAISTSGTLTNDDVDSPETFVAQTDTAGDYGTFSIDANGAWTYTASSAHDEFVGGTTYTDTFTVAAADGTLTSVTINILGTNDAAVLSADVEELTEGDTAAAISTSGTLTNDDVDSPETFVAQTDTAGDYGTFSIDANGAWTYTASSAHDEFVGGTTYTDTFTVAAADGTLTSVTINILGTNDAAVLSADVEELTEGDTAAAISTSGTLTNDDVDSPETFVAQTDTAGDYGTFSIDANGAWTYTASSAHDEFVGGTTYTDTFTVAAADGTLTSVTINILGTNDAAVLSADVEELTEGDTAAAISTSGTLTNDDVDSPETFVAQTDTAGDYGTFSIDANGAWTYTASSAHDEFVGGTTYTDTFTVAAADGTLTSVTINILGTNDAPQVIALTGSVGEDGPTFSSNLLAGATDVDSPVLSIQNPSASITTTGGRVLTSGVEYTVTGGVFALTAAGFALFNNLNNAQQDSFVLNFEVSDGLAATANTLTVTVNGSDDNHAPVITTNGAGPTASVSVAENSTTVTTVQASDADVGDTVTYSLVGGVDQAKFTINSGTGALTFIAAPNFEAPTDDGGNNVYDVVVQASDLHGAIDTQAIAVTVTNVNEPPSGFNFQLALAATTTGDTGNNGLNTNTAIGTFLPTGDPDSAVFTFSFLGVPPAGFAINPTTGVLSTNATVAVSPTPYSLTVVASDGVNSFSTPLKIWVLGTGADTASGSGSDIDIMYGANGNDTLNGNGGSDAILGGSQNDAIFGGLGADQLFGGAGNDSFIYTATNESPAGAGNRDTIFDFGDGSDKLTLTAVDANTTLAGDQAFTFVVAATASIVNNSITWHQAGGNTYIHGDNNGDGIADFEIELLGIRTMVAGDFNL